MQRADSQTPTFLMLIGASGEAFATKRGKQMQTNVKCGKPRRSRIKSLVATLGVTAAIAGVAMPAAAPATASAMASSNCHIYSTIGNRYSNAGNRAAATFWWGLFDLCQSDESWV
jgi:hypothetical protein